MPTRLTQDDPHGVEAGAASSERDSRLVAILGRQALELAPPHVGRVRDDDIVALPAQRAEVVGFQKPHPPAEAVATDVGTGNFQRFLGDIHGIDLRTRKRFCAGDRNTTRAGPYIEYATHPPRIDPRRELPLDELRYG